VFTEIPELMRVEIGSQVCDDGVGEAKTMQDVTDEANHSIRKKRCDWLVVDPLGKLVYGHQHVSKTTRRSGQGPYRVQAPACKWPLRWYGDEFVSRDMGLFAEELAVCAPTNECFGIYQSSWQVETRSKSLAD
jgi:hypothetical protein